MAHLVEHDIALEVCPTSNVCTRSVPSLAEHPLPALVAAGVPVTINSDDPPMFATTLTHEYVVAAELLGLDAAGLAELARAGVRHSFADDVRKAQVLDEIDSLPRGVWCAPGPTVTDVRRRRGAGRRAHRPRPDHRRRPGSRHRSHRHGRDPHARRARTGHRSSDGGRAGSRRAGHRRCSPCSPA